MEDLVILYQSFNLPQDVPLAYMQLKSVHYAPAPLKLLPCSTL